MINTFLNLNLIMDDVDKTENIKLKQRPIHISLEKNMFTNTL